MNVIPFPGPHGVHGTIVGRELRPSDVAEALRMWASWSVDLPPVDVTGDPVADLRLANAFRRLLTQRDAQARLEEIEAMLAMPSDFPPPDQSPDIVRAILISWWFAIYDQTRAGLM